MAARGLRSAADLAAGKPCGTRVRYYAGCRCQACRQANTAYERARAAARQAGDWNGLVSAERARQHIEWLRTRGVGFKTTADAAKVAASIVSAVLYGQRTNVRARTEKRILAVTDACALDRAYIDAAPSWVLLRELLASGYPKARIASEIIGRPARNLQLGRERITVRNADRVRRVWERLRCASAAETRAADKRLRELSEEGFQRDRVRRELDALAVERGQDKPELALRKGRMLHASVRLVEAVHARLMQLDLLEEPA